MAEQKCLHQQFIEPAIDIKILCKSSLEASALNPASRHLTVTIPCMGKTTND